MSHIVQHVLLAMMPCGPVMTRPELKDRTGEFDGSSSGWPSGGWSSDWSSSRTLPPTVEGPELSVRVL